MTLLSDGDAVVLIKDLKVKGTSVTLKVGTKIKSIRLAGGDHEMDCRMDAGSFMLKACYEESLKIKVLSLGIAAREFYPKNCNSPQRTRGAQVGQEVKHFHANPPFG